MQGNFQQFQDVKIEHETTRDADMSKRIQKYGSRKLDETCDEYTRGDNT